MQRVNQYDFYSLGFTIHPLTELKENAKLGEVFWVLYNAKSWLDYLLGQQLIPISVSAPGAQSLRAAIEKVLPENLNAPGALEKQLSLEEHFYITNRAKILETVLAAEFQALDTYFVSQKLAYATHDLIENAEKVFPQDILPDLPDEAKEDVRQAGKCIAFDIPTAAGFHILRATESVIRKYYEAVVGKKPKTKMRNWGAYITNLEKAGADRRITGLLDHIRELYRNPILHPEDTLSTQEAQVLLGTAVSAVVQMTGEIRKLNAAKQPAPTPLAVAARPKP